MDILFILLIFIGSIINFINSIKQFRRINHKSNEVIYHKLTVTNRDKNKSESNMEEQDVIYNNMNQMEMAARCLMSCSTTFHASSLHPLHPLIKFICFILLRSKQLLSWSLPPICNIPISPDPLARTPDNF